MSVTVKVEWNGSELSLKGLAVGSGPNKNKIKTQGTGITYKPSTGVKSVDKFVVLISEPPDAPPLCVETTDKTLEVKNPGVTVTTRWDYTLYATTTAGPKTLDPIWEDDP